jgi:hypothetical protein
LQLGRRKRKKELQDLPTNVEYYEILVTR